MKNTFRSLLLISASLLLLGCSPQQPQESSEKILQNFLINLSSNSGSNLETASSYSLTMDYQSGEDTLSLSANINAAVNLTEAQNPKAAIDITAEGKGAIQGQSGNINIDLDLASLDQKLYATLNTLKLETPDPQTNLIINLLTEVYAKKTFFFPFQSDLINKLNQTTRLTSPDQKLSKETLEKITTDHFFLTLVNTLNEREFEVSINTQKLIDYFQAISLASGQQSNPQDFESLKKLDSLISYKLILGIGESPHYKLTKMEVQLQLLPQPPTNNSGTINIIINSSATASKGTISAHLEDNQTNLPIDLDIDFTSSSNPTKSVSITAPPNAQEFNLEGLFGGLKDETPVLSPSP